MGYTALTVRPATQAAPHSLRATDRGLENRFFKLDLNASGEITCLWDKVNQRDVIAEGETGNQLQLFQDGPERESAWNVHATFDKRTYAWDPGTEIRVRETGPVRAVVRVSRRYRESALEQDITLYDRVPRIDFVTRVNWQARQVMLKATFPLAVRSAHGTFEIQYAAVERPTHRNSSWDQEKFEVCAHRWADLSEAGYGASLMNDCKYGHDLRGSTMRLTLLRGTESPDPDADRGAHEFTYALFPHAGDWVTAETVRRAWELNAPIICVPGSGQPPGPESRCATFEVEGPAVLETVKPAEDGNGTILRFYEPHGGRGPVRVRTPLPPAMTWSCNHVEEDGEAWPVMASGFEFPIGPFEVRTFRVSFSS
jgi:alpha-mannosidase